MKKVRKFPLTVRASPSYENTKGKRGGAYVAALPLRMIHIASWIRPRGERGGGLVAAPNRNRKKEKDCERTH